MRFARSFSHLLLPAAAIALVAAALPPALRGPGLWEVSTEASGAGAARHCLADPAILMQWEHRSTACTRVVLSSTTDRSDVRYTCPGGGFGNSKAEVITPRSVRIATQGISGGLPFAYTIHARRVGACPVVKR